jgi:hypothetical protein
MEEIQKLRWDCYKGSVRIKKFLLLIFNNIAEISQLFLSGNIDHKFFRADI